MADEDDQKAAMDFFATPKASVPTEPASDDDAAASFFAKPKPAEPTPAATPAPIQPVAAPPVPAVAPPPATGPATGGGLDFFSRLSHGSLSSGGSSLAPPPGITPAPSPSLFTPPVQAPVVAPPPEPEPPVAPPEPEPAPTPASTPDLTAQPTVEQGRRKRVETAFMGGLNPTLLGAAARSAVAKAEGSGTQPVAPTTQSTPELAPVVAAPAPEPEPAPTPTVPLAASEPAPAPEDDAADFFSTPNASAPGPAWSPPPHAPAPEPAPVRAEAAPSPTRAAAPMVADFEDDLPPKKKGNMGMIFAAVAIAGASAVAVVLAGGGGSDAAQVQASNETADKAPADSKASAKEDGPPAEAAGEAAPEQAAPEQAAPEDAAPEDAAPEDAAPEPPEPADTGSSQKKSKKKSKSKSKSKSQAAASASSGKSADELLSEARKAAMGGNHSQAYDLAKKSYDKKKSSAALQLMGVSACNMKAAGKAKFVVKKLSGSKRDQIVNLCKAKGVSV